MNTLLLANQTGHTQLQRLTALRAIAIFAQCITLALVHYLLNMTLPWLPMILCIVVLLMLNLFSWLRLRIQLSVSNLELFVQLSVDVAANSFVPTKTAYSVELS